MGAQTHNPCFRPKSIVRIHRSQKPQVHPNSGQHIISPDTFGNPRTHTQCGCVHTRSDDPTEWTDESLCIVQV